MNIEQSYELNKKTFNTIIQKVYTSKTGEYIVMGSGYPNYTLYLFNSEGTLLWKKDVNGHISNVMISDDETYVVYGIGRGSTVGDVVCHDIQGNELWRYKTGKTVKSIYIPDDDSSTVVVGTNEGYIYLINEGNLIWNSKTRSWNEKISVFMKEKTIHAISHQGIYYKFNPEVGMEPMEKKDLGIVVGDVSFGRDASALLHNMNNKEISFITPIQKILWTKTFNTYISSSNIAENGNNIIIGMNDGLLYLYDKLGNLKISQNFSSKINDIFSNGNGIIIALNSFRVEYISMSGKSLWSMGKDSITITQEYLANQKMARHAQNMVSLAKDTLNDIKAYGISIPNFEDIITRAERAFAVKKYDLTVNLLRNVLIEMRKVKKDAQLTAEKKNTASMAIQQVKDAYDRLELEGFNLKPYEVNIFNIEELFRNSEFKQVVDESENLKRKLESIPIHKSKAYSEITAARYILDNIKQFCNIDEEMSIFEQAIKLADTDPVEARNLIQKARESAIMNRQDADPNIDLDFLMDDNGNFSLELYNNGKAHAYDVSIEASGQISMKILKDFDFIAGKSSENVPIDMDILGEGLIKVIFTVTCRRKFDGKNYAFKKEVDLEIE